MVRFKAFLKNKVLELRLRRVVDCSKGGFQPLETHGRWRWKAMYIVSLALTMTMTVVGVDWNWQPSESSWTDTTAPSHADIGRLVRPICSAKNSIKMNTVDYGLSNEPSTKVVHHPLTSPKWSSDIQIWSLSHTFWHKSIRTLLQHFIVWKNSSGKVVVQSTTYRMVLTFLQGMTPFP